jgi:pimeloyl-ACP methyl ester carboxylesterase
MKEIVLQGPAVLYLHGFASGPESAKGRAVAEHYRARGIFVKRLDLRRPSMENLRLSAMIAHVNREIGGPRDRAVLFGSSLGGLTACRVAEDDARVCALVLLAPAFRMIERWVKRMGEDAWRAWRETNAFETEDHANGGTVRIDFGFAEDAVRVDSEGGGWPDVRVPTLILHGTNDDVVDVNLSRTWAKGKRNVRLIEVDDDHELAGSIERILRESERFLEGALGQSGSAHA